MATPCVLMKQWFERHHDDPYSPCKNEKKYPDSKDRNTTEMEYTMRNLQSFGAAEVCAGIYLGEGGVVWYQEGDGVGDEDEVQ